MGGKSAAAFEERLPDFPLWILSLRETDSLPARLSGRRVAAGWFRALRLWDYRQERLCYRIRFWARWHTRTRMHPDGSDTEIRPGDT